MKYSEADSRRGLLVAQGWSEMKIGKAKRRDRITPPDPAFDQRSKPVADASTDTRLPDGQDVNRQQPINRIGVEN